MAKQDSFTFEISLSVLNHLGRSLYRSFATVLGEAISNAWDADAKRVDIYISKDENIFVIKDNGIGMTRSDFQDKFLKIGYSKRKAGNTRSKKGRPFIGRKGIGKLALLSCAARITVVSKVSRGKYVGGVIDNSELDDAITEDLTPKQYPLQEWKPAMVSAYIKDHKHGTVIRFDQVKGGIRNSFPLLSKIIALYFRFSLLDPSFSIYVNDEKITYRSLNDLAVKTDFLWLLGDYKDPYVDQVKTIFAREPDDHETGVIVMKDIKGFIASVKKPRDLKIMTTEERVGIDLFVNGRLRERDILKHTPTARVAESYLYGQIHYDSLDDSVDRFTSSREGVVADDPVYQKFLETFRTQILKVVDQWDKWRIKHRQEGDPDNERITRRERASRGLFGAASEEYELEGSSKKKKERVAQWVEDLADDASFNFDSYADCFIAENLIRKYIKENKVKLSTEAQEEVAKWKKKEKESKGKGNISITVRRAADDTMYLSMDHLANLVDKGDLIKESRLARDANEYKPIRDAVAHTALLTPEAKVKLHTVRDNIKGRVKTILAESK